MAARCWNESCRFETRSCAIRCVVPAGVDFGAWFAADGAAAEAPGSQLLSWRSTRPASATAHRSYVAKGIVGRRGDEKTEAIVRAAPPECRIPTKEEAGPASSRWLVLAQTSSDADGAGDRFSRISIVTRLPARRRECLQLARRTPPPTVPDRRRCSGRGIGREGHSAPGFDLSGTQTAIRLGGPRRRSPLAVLGDGCGEEADQRGGR
jgi:hypothetical protein